MLFEVYIYLKKHDYIVLDIQFDKESNKPIKNQTISYAPLPKHLIHKFCFGNES